MWSAPWWLIEAGFGVCPIALIVGFVALAFADKERRLARRTHGIAVVAFGAAFVAVINTYVLSGLMADLTNVVVGVEVGMLAASSVYLTVALACVRRARRQSRASRALDD